MRLLCSVCHDSFPNQVGLPQTDIRPRIHLEAASDYRNVDSALEADMNHTDGYLSDSSSTDLTDVPRGSAVAENHCEPLVAAEEYDILTANA